MTQSSPFYQFDEKILQKILVSSCFCNNKWKLRQRTQLRQLSHKWLNKFDSKVEFLPFNFTTLSAADLVKILCWFPNLKKFIDVDSEVRGYLNEDLYSELEAIIRGNFQLKQQLISKIVSIPVEWQHESHFDLKLLARQGFPLNVYFEPCSLQEIFDFNELISVGYNITVDIRINYDLEDCIQNEKQLRLVQTLLLSMKEKIVGLYLYSIEKIFSPTFFRTFMQQNCKTLQRLNLHYSFDPLWHKLFAQEKELLIQQIAQVENVCQYCSADETDIRIMGQVPFTELVLSNAGIRTRDGHTFLVELQSHILYPEDIRKLEIGHFPVHFFCDMTVGVFLSWQGILDNLVDLSIQNYDRLFDQCFESVRFSKLKSLFLGNLRDLRNINFLQGLKSLENLTLKWAPGGIQLPLVLELNQLPKLKSMKLCSCKKIEDIKGLRGLSDFEQVVLKNCSQQVVDCVRGSIGDNVIIVEL